MSLSIEPLLGFEWECGYGAIVAAAKFFGCDYQLGYKDLWKFDYLESEDENLMLGKRIETSKIETVEALYDYCNFKLTDIVMFSAKEVIAKIKGELKEGRPAKLRMDLFFCPWHKEAYKRLHMPHSFLALDFNEKTESFSFIDHSPILSEGILNVEDIPTDIEYTVSVFEMVDKVAKDVNWQQMIIERCENVIGKSSSKNMFEQQRDFAQKLLNLTSMSSEYGDAEEFMQTEIYKNAIRVSQHRTLYAEFLKFIAEKYEIPDLTDSINNMVTAADKWDKIKNVLVKASMLDDPKIILKRIYDKIMNLSVFEEKIAEDLLKVAVNSKEAIYK